VAKSKSEIKKNPKKVFKKFFNDAPGSFVPEDNTVKPLQNFTKRNTDDLSKDSSKEPFKKSLPKKTNSVASKTETETPFKKFYKSKPEVFKEEFSKEKSFKKSFDKPTTALDSKIRTRLNKIDEHNTEIEINSARDAKNNGDHRLNKYLAHAGIASRRKADELIADGRVKVNGEVVREMGYKVKPNDKITFDDKKLSPEQKVYILINKPKDCITTTSDEKDRKTVLDLIRGAYAQIKSLKKPRLYPVGRLDRNTTGVLLITNDGELAQNLTHPSKEIRKIYQVNLNRKLTAEDAEKIRHGVVLEDGIASVNELAYTDPKNKAEVGVEIHSGKNRIVRRIFESLDYEVVKLDRVFFGGLTKKDLPRGRWRFLTEQEVLRLKHFKL
jgi:23S rRNA pseudouridine2605 synthase